MNVAFISPNNLDPALGSVVLDVFDVILNRKLYIYEGVSLLLIFFKESPPSVSLQQLLHIVNTWFFFKGWRWDSTGEVFHYCCNLTCSEIFSQQRPSVLLCRRFNLTVMTDAMVFLVCWLVRKNRALQIMALMIYNITWRLEFAITLFTPTAATMADWFKNVLLFFWFWIRTSSMRGSSASEAGWVWRWEHFEVLQDNN